LIGADGEQVGIVPLAEALDRAEQAELDLVEISPNADLPVCRIMDFGKHQFQKAKQQAAAKKNHKQTQLKEIKFRPGTEDGDYQVKLKKIKEFLEFGNKVKASLRFRGREMAHQRLGMELLNRVKDDLVDVGQVDQFPKLEGRQMVMILSPKRK
jgi:translation initiation factor IF-3